MNESNYQDSPEYQQAQEWLKFLESLEMDRLKSEKGQPTPVKSESTE